MDGNLKSLSHDTIPSDCEMSSGNSSFGSYLRLVTAQTTNSVILDMAQNGGVVTGLLTYALEKKVIDGAIVSAIGKEIPFCPVPMLAKTSQEILESAGTRYSYSPNVQILSEVSKQDVKAIAFVGTPCQITAVRRMQERKLDCARAVKLLIGLMCSEAFSYEDLIIKHVQNQLGVNLRKVRKTQIVGNEMIITTDETKIAVHLAEIKKFARKSCKKCLDFSAELADLSMGSLGLRQWTFVIVRTPIGERLFAEAERAKAFVTRPVQMDDSPVQLLLKLSKKKHNREGKS